MSLKCERCFVLFFALSWFAGFGPMGGYRMAMTLVGFCVSSVRMEGVTEIR